MLERNLKELTSKNGGSVLRRSPLRRLGCLVLLLVWAVVMLIPFAFLIVAIRGEITILYGVNIPDRYEHPRIQIRLINEVDYRGFNVTNATLHYGRDNDLCIQTNVRFLLWQGEADAVEFCDCYTRNSDDDVWMLMNTSPGGCE